MQRDLPAEAIAQYSCSILRESIMVSCGHRPARACEWVGLIVDDPIMADSGASQAQWLSSITVRYIAWCGRDGCRLNAGIRASIDCGRRSSQSRDAWLRAGRAGLKDSPTLYGDGVPSLHVDKPTVFSSMLPHLSLCMWKALRVSTLSPRNSHCCTQ